jgi:hypothetical protein
MNCYPRILYLHVTCSCVRKARCSSLDWDPRILDYICRGFHYPFEAEARMFKFSVLYQL